MCATVIKNRRTEEQNFSFSPPERLRESPFLVALSVFFHMQLSSRQMEQGKGKPLREVADIICLYAETYVQLSPKDLIEDQLLSRDVARRHGLSAHQIAILACTYLHLHLSPAQIRESPFLFALSSYLHTQLSSRQVEQGQGKTLHEVADIVCLYAETNMLSSPKDLIEGQLLSRDVVKDRGLSTHQIAILACSYLLLSPAQKGTSESIIGHTFSIDYRSMFVSKQIVIADQANIFLLPEKHSHDPSVTTPSRIVNGQFISYLASHGPLTVLIEGVPCWHSPTQSSNVLSRLYCINSEHSNISYYGWDTCTSLMTPTQKAIHKREILLKKVKKIDEASKNSPKEKREELIDEKKSYLVDIDFLQKFIDSQIRYSFPCRTRAMVATLRKLRRMKGNDSDKMKYVFIAGMLHLMETPGMAKEFDISQFYSELNNHKAVIMVPTILR